MKGSLLLNSTRLARFCTALATSFKERDEDSEGLPTEGPRNRVISEHCTYVRIYKNSFIAQTLAHV